MSESHRAKVPVHVTVLQSLIKDGPATNLQLVERTGCTFSSVRMAVAGLRLRKGAVHVSGYVWSTTRYAMIFTAGSAVDATCPPPPGRNRAIAADAERAVMAALACGPRTLASIIDEDSSTASAIELAARRLGRQGLVRPPKRRDRPALWHLAEPEEPDTTPRRAIPIPAYALRTVFVGGINPWTGISQPATL